MSGTGPPQTGRGPHKNLDRCFSVCYTPPNFLEAHEIVFFELKQNILGGRRLRTFPRVGIFENTGNGAVNGLFPIQQKNLLP